MPLEIKLPPGRTPIGYARLTTLTGDTATVTTGGKGRLARATRDLPAAGTSIVLTTPPSSVSVLEISLNPSGFFNHP
jgi:hypothetical protein